MYCVCYRMLVILTVSETWTMYECMVMCMHVCMAETRVQELYSSNRHLVIIERPLESSGNSVDSGFADFMYWEVHIHTYIHTYMDTSIPSSTVHVI